MHCKRSFVIATEGRCPAVPSIYTSAVFVPKYFCTIPSDGNSKNVANAAAAKAACDAEADCLADKLSAMLCKSQ